MKLSPCYNPKAVYNNYVGSYVFARCGKCPACINTRAANWVTRLDLEQHAHKYTFFCTFQYDEQHVSQLVRVDDLNLSDEIMYIDSETSQVFLLSDCPDVTEKDIQFCKDSKIITFINVRDFQLFIKNLRKYVVKHYGTNFRYFNSFEYGPSTLRCHSHCLFFFDSSLLSEKFAVLLNNFWKHGTCYEPHQVDGSASSYVASYVNCFANLPAIYRHRLLRQKSTFSTRPPIGLVSFDYATIKNVLLDGHTQITLFKNGDFQDVPLWRSFESRLFPKCPRFGHLSIDELLRVYSIAEKIPFIDDIVCYGLSVTDFVAKYLLMWHLPWYRDYFDLCFRTSDGFNYDSFKRFVRMLINFRDVCLTLNITSREYVYLIVNYYAKKSKSQFEEFLYLQSVYFGTHPVRDYLKFFPTFLREVNGRPFGSLSPSKKFYLKFYGYYFRDTEIVSVFNDSSDMADLRSLHDRIYYQNTKTKINTDYLLANKDEFGNVINFYNL